MNIISAQPKTLTQNQLTLRFMGTGSVYAAPVLGCHCTACKLARVEPARKRLPCSLLVSTPQQQLLIDAGHPELAEQIEKHDISRILLTHYHPDHVQGLFHLRWSHDSLSMPVIGPDDPVGCADLYKNHGILDFSQKTQHLECFTLDDLLITPLKLNHSKLTHGYYIEFEGISFAYLTDTRGISDEVAQFLASKQLSALILDCTFAPTEKPKNHNNLTDALKIYEQLGKPDTWLTHIGHGMDAWFLADDNSTLLPDNVWLAGDGLTI